jgi:hypothetical protein
MKTLYIPFSVLIVLGLSSCTYTADSTDSGAVQPQADYGVVDLGEGRVVVTDVLDESRNNNVNPHGLDSSVHTVTTHASFYTGSDSYIYLDPDFHSLRCDNGAYPNLRVSLNRGYGETSFSPRTRVYVSPYTDYVLTLTFDLDHCYDEFSFWFGLRAG